MAEDKKVLNPPHVPSRRYERNFIKNAVCELRFPTLLELETTPPRKFQAQIRKNYPSYESQVVNLVGPADISRETRYVFRSKDKNWLVTVKSSALALETSKYVDFEDFYEKLDFVLRNARQMVDSDFYTRVGLRYTNSIPIEDGNIDGWIRRDLILPLTGGVLGDLERYSGLVQGYTARGQYNFRHSLSPRTSDNKANADTYILDFDYYSENVEFGQVRELVHEFHATNFSLFSWCIGEKAKRLLGEGQPK